MKELREILDNEIKIDKKEKEKEQWFSKQNSKWADYMKKPILRLDGEMTKEELFDFLNIDIEEYSVEKKQENEMKELTDEDSIKTIDEWVIFKINSRLIGNVISFVDQRWKWLLTLKIKEINDKSVTYKYYPNDDENIKPGVIQMDIDSLQILNAKKSGIENNTIDNYFIHAIDRIHTNTNKRLFPDSELVAWG